MHFAPTDEQAQLQEIARDFLAANPSATWEQVVETGADSEREDVRVRVARARQQLDALEE